MSSSKRAKTKRADRPEKIDTAQAYSIETTCAALDISRAQYYVLLKEGRIRPLPDFRPPRISGAEILRITQAAG